MEKGVLISNGNTKLGNIPNTSVVPVRDCKNSKRCRTLCYALKAWRMYPSVRRAWGHNSTLWRKSPRTAAISVISWIKSKRSVPYFRIHVAGDFINQRHLDCWKEVARACPGTEFLAFTKRYDLDMRHLSRNLHVRYSTWPGLNLPPKRKSISRAWMQDGTETRIPADAFACDEGCSNCKVCWDTDRDTWFKEH